MTVLIDESQIKGYIQRLAKQIYETNSDPTALLGLGDNGTILAKRLSKYILNEYGTRLLVGKLDVTLYKSPSSSDHFVTLGQSEISFSLKNKTVILVTDQVNTGRTMIAGLNALSDYSEPSVIKCCCLVFRECIRRPIYFEYVGETVAQPISSSLICSFYEKDGEDMVELHV